MKAYDPMPSTRNAYDHRLRDLVWRLANVDVAVQLGVPRSTAKSWLRRGPLEVVTNELLNTDAERLRASIVRLERRVEVLRSVIRLLLFLVRMAGTRLGGERVPSGARKAELVRAVDRATRAIPRGVALRVLGLTPARYHAWHGATPCPLDDRSSCPKTRPTQLAAAEVRAMREMVTSLEYRHFSVRALALHAQRMGRVLAAPGTWSRRIREYGWIRPRRRLHPPKPKDGIRATRPNELWHIDVTIIKLLDGTRLYLHAVIDNYSRKLLAWKLAARLEPTTTCSVLAAAASHLPDVLPTVVADSGVENVNGEIDRLLDLGRIRRVLAQVEVSYSNSMIEAWWRNLKHSWLYLHTLDSASAVQRLVAFYVEQHNTVMPHRAFDGRTPDEIYFGKEVDLAARLAEQRRRARVDRVAANRAVECNECAPQRAPEEPLAREAA